MATVAGIGGKYKNSDKKDDDKGPTAILMSLGLSSAIDGGRKESKSSGYGFKRGEAKTPLPRM
jgi:hypothetical protein